MRNGPSKIGNRHADIALKFSKRFRVGETITVESFDLWGMEVGEMTCVPTGSRIDPEEAETDLIGIIRQDYQGISKTSAFWGRLLSERNNLRGRINAGAASNHFREKLGVEPFSVDVNEFGNSYHIRPTFESYEMLARQLPANVERVARTKRRRIARLHSSMNHNQLPIGHQVMIVQLELAIEDFMLDCKRRIDDFDRKCARVEKMIADWNAANPAMAIPGLDRPKMRVGEEVGS